MLTRTYSGQFENLASISEFVAQAAEDAGFDRAGIYAVKLAVDEACTNIIEHAYGGEGSGEIQCTCNIARDELSITLRDWGEAFVPDSVPEPDFDVPLEELRFRGAGLFFMRKVMDEVHFDFQTGDGNVLVMVKRK